MSIPLPIRHSRDTQRLTKSSLKARRGNLSQLELLNSQPVLSLTRGRERHELKGRREVVLVQHNVSACREESKRAPEIELLFVLWEALNFNTPSIHNSMFSQSGSRAP